MSAGRACGFSAVLAVLGCGGGEDSAGALLDANADATVSEADTASESAADAIDGSPEADDGALPIVPIAKGPDISPWLVGQNLWYPSSVEKVWPLVQKSGVRIIRIGGIAPDKTPPTSAQMLAWVDAIRAIGAEPLVQVSRNSTPTEAADLVRFLNVTNKRAVKSWSIGNEPDHDGLTAAVVGPYVRARAPAMRDIDPSITIFAPDCAWYDVPLLSALIGGAEDITGKDGKGRFFVDGITWHRYPFGNTYDRGKVLGEAIDGTRASIEDLIARMKAADATHGRTGAQALTWAMGELNVTYDNPSSNTVDGVGVHSFLDGQFFAQIYALGMQHRAVFVASWSVHESSGNRGPTDLGYLDGPLSSPVPRSTYWHMQMIAQEMTGRFASVSSSSSSVRAFGAGNGKTLSLMLLNVDLAATQTFTIRLDAGPISGSGAVKLVVDGGVPSEHSGSIGPQSTALIVFGAGGKPLRRIDYSLDSATKAAPPTLTAL